MSTSLKKQKRPTKLKTEDSHPFSTQVAGGELVIHTSLEVAKARLIELVQNFDTEFKRFGATGAVDCVNAIQTVGAEGGDIEEVLDTHSGLKFRASIRKRTI